MKKIELVKSGRVEKTIEVEDYQFPDMMYSAKLRVELLKRDTGEDWTAREYRPPVKPPTPEELYEMEREEAIAEKEREILRAMAISELEAEKK